MEQMYLNWLEDPKSVHPSWNAYFINLNHQIPPESSFLSPEEAQKNNMIPTGNANLSGFGGVSKEVLTLKKMAKFFRNFGHLISDLDPLELKINKFQSEVDMARFELDYYFPKENADKPISISGTDNILLNSRKSWTPRELFDHLKSVYCGKIAYSYQHISNPEVRKWIETRLEVESQEPVSKEVHEELLNTILESQAFSDFCTRKFSTLKRFGADGLDSGIVAIKELLNKFHEYKGDQFVLGMAHRGRLNTLPCVFEKPYTKMFIEFFDRKMDFIEDPVKDFYGDVKYHNGYSTQNTHKSGNQMFIQMLPNPSHLEAVNPLVMGYARGKMDLLKDPSGDKVLPVLIHGDAALSGQGIIYETLQMEKLRGYSVGGTIHLVFNNQVGFTTEPLDGRSGRYSTYVGKTNENMIIMVNADDPVKVRQAVIFALDYRNEFKKDVFVDIIGYRKYGHNEQDNPRFTQPVMYKTIDAMKPMYQKYSDQLISQGFFTREEIDSKYDYYYNEVIDKQYELVKNDQFDPAIYDLKRNDFSMYIGSGQSGLDLDTFRQLGEKLYNLDMPDFKIDNTVKRLYKMALKSITEGKGISWATAEHMAFASLLNEGHAVRLSGEDCERGTFSHRQSVIVNQENNQKYFPLTKMLSEDRQGDLTIVNSLLSEYGVLGFDYGFSWARPDSLTLWEAQFGDFANGAQIIIDQYLMNSEKKWRRFSGLVMLLPHGYDGNGPEHSNARVERFLANIDDNFILAKDSQEYRDNLLELTNAQVVNITSASNYFHILRDQVKKKERKPLIVMSPKKILMSREVQSDIEEFGTDRKFRPIIEDTNPKAGIKKILLCSGQIYFDLNNRRNKLGLENEIAIIRLERIGPFAYNEFAEAVQGYSKDTEFVFVSEEQFNFGAFSFLQMRVNMMLDELGFEGELQYVGRKISGSSSTGINWLHKQEIEEILTDAVGEIKE
jgi:2-oxoglutarate dehydrogenase E1 component